MFGSDWIMLDREVHHQRYVETIRLRSPARGLEFEWQDNFLRDNLRRFLSIA